MKVLQPGQRVLIDDEIGATINEVSIHATGRILYELAWWNGHIRQLGKFLPEQVRPTGEGRYWTLTD